MPHSHLDNHSYQNLLFFLKKLEDIHSKDFTIWLRDAGLSVLEWQQIVSGKEMIPVQTLFSISKITNVPLHHILNSQVDYKVLDDQINIHSNLLPERYTKGARGKKRTVINILKYIENNFGQEEIILVLKHFQLKPSHFINEDENINNLFLVDLLDILRKLGRTTGDIIRMGEFSYNVNKNSSLGNALASSASYKSHIINLVENNSGMYDQNFIYKIHRLKNNYAQISMIPNPEVQSELSIKNIGSLDALIMKLGVVKSSPRYINRPDFKASIVKSIHLGDSCCMFEINFSENQNQIYH